MESVSVVIPLFNKEKHIRCALESVAAQSYPFFEVLIVDDGSTDDGAGIAAAYPDERFRVIRQSRGGAAAARNTGIAAARHSLIAFLDADDEWMPDFLDTALALHHKWPQAGMLATAYMIEKGGCFRRARLIGVPKDQGLIPNYFRSVLRDIPVISSAVMIPRGIFDRVGVFEEGAQLGEDQDMWCRIALEFPVAYCTRPGAVYHQDTPNSICFDISVVEEYPVMHTVGDAIPRNPQRQPYLRKYLCKLRLDYAVRLIRAARFAEAAAAIVAAGWRMPAKTIIAVYYLLTVFIKKKIGFMGSAE